MVLQVDTVGTGRGERSSYELFLYSGGRVLVRPLRTRERDPELDRLTLHVRKFAAMMTGLHGDRHEGWITDAEQDTLVPLAGFAHNLRRDFDAVRNGLSLPHSSGAVEGNINRLKMLKRQMFGRAGLDLLRKRALLAR
ncbi:transposase [Streptomyces sp. NPDC050504]|uniref:transposase n=1 Tax=Streptomyces sp. NPDC050504 TaxID=3365618 RepID=UPI0037AE2D00